MWDYDSWDVLSARQVTLARDAGALIALPLAFTIRAGAHVLAGEFTEAASVVARAESAAEATGSSMAPYGALALVVFQGWEAQAAELILTATADAERRGEGAALSFVQWADAVLCNSLGRYEEALGAAQRASDDSPAVRFSSWALVAASLPPRCAHGKAPQRRPPHSADPWASLRTRCQRMLLALPAAAGPGGLQLVRSLLPLFLRQ